MSIFNKNRRLLIIVFLAALFLGSFYAHKLRVPRRRYADFHCFYTAGKRILNQQNIYVIRDPEVAEFRYAPIFAVIMSGLALVDEYDADTVWYILNFCLVIVSFVLLKRIVVSQELGFRNGLILYILAILGTLRFILNNFSSGQSNILMMASLIIGLYYISGRREVLGAAILAFSIMIKYTPLVFIPYFIIRRKIKIALAITISAIIYFLLPALFIGVKTNFSYIKGLIPFLRNSTILDQMTILDPKNQSLLSFINRIFTNCLAYFHAPPMPFQSLNLNSTGINLVFIFSAIIIYLLSIMPTFKKPPPKEPIISRQTIDYALLFICVVLFNLNSWMPNYILLSFAYFIIVDYLIRNNFKDRIVSLLWILSYILNIITIESILGETITHKLNFYSPFTISALLTFIALLKIRRNSTSQC